MGSYWWGPGSIKPLLVENARSPRIPKNRFYGAPRYTFSYFPVPLQNEGNFRTSLTQRSANSFLRFHPL
jgi:hypothetical protein